MDLEDLRQRIDQIDVQIVRLINERASVSSQIGRAKQGGEGGAFRPGRERQVYDRILSLNEGPLPDDCLKAVYREIMSGSLSLQMPTVVSYLGPPGTFTHMAAVSKFGDSVEYAHERDIRDVFARVSQGRAQYGIVPIENSTEGGVNQTIDLFIESAVNVVSEVFVPIHHNFLVRDPEAEVKVIYSHPQGFAQCRRWLSLHHDTTEYVETVSTSRAAERAAAEPNAAAIASERAAQINGLTILEQAIEDNPHNITRFFVISLQQSEPTGEDKTSVMFSIKHEPGALYHILGIFNARELNLTRIESRPSKLKAWEYFFFVDLEGHVANGNIEQALEELEKHCRQLQILGSYPAAERIPMPTATGGSR